MLFMRSPLSLLGIAGGVVMFECLPNAMFAQLRTESAPTVPLIAVTAFSMPGEREAAISAGCSEYFTKPIVPETFLSEVDRLLPIELQGSDK